MGRQKRPTITQRKSIYRRNRAGPGAQPSSSHPSARFGEGGNKESKLTMEQQSWRNGIAQDSRNKIVSKIMDTLQRHAPLPGQNGVNELWKIANRFEEKMFYAASDLHEYLRNISSKMLILEKRTQNATNNTLPTGSSGTNQGPVRPLVDSGSIAQGQSRQQVQPTPAGMLNNGIQGLAGGPESSFLSIRIVPQPPLASAGSIGQAQSQQQVVQPTPLGMLNNGIQGSAGGPTSNFSGINNGTNQVPVRPLVDSGGPGDSSQQVGQAGGIDQADIVWSKMQALTEKYLQDMKDLNSMLTTRSQKVMIEEERAYGKRIYCCFVDFGKAFDKIDTS